MAQALLNADVNDLGGTLMDETISRSAGANFGEELTPSETVGQIRDGGVPARRRGTLYQNLETYDDHDPEDLGPLKPRTGSRFTSFADECTRVRAVLVSEQRGAVS